MAIFVLDQLFKNGLRPQGEGLVNNEFLSSATNVICTPTGCQLHTAIAAGNLTPPAYDEWPFPQLFRPGFDFVDTDSAVNDADWFLGKTTIGKGPNYAAVSTYNSITPASTLAITAGYGWHEAYFQGVWFATNNACTLMRLPNLSWKVCVGTNDTPANAVSCATVTSFDNRLIMGSFNPSAYFTAPHANWTKVWDAWRTAKKQHSMSYHGAFIALGSVLMYSQRYGGDYEYPFYLEMAALGYLGATNFAKVEGAILGRIENGDFGFIAVQGPIKKVLPLGDLCIVYCQNSITALDKNLEPHIINPSVGIWGRSCADGDSSGHYYLDRSARLCKLNPDLSVEHLDYREYLYNLLTLLPNSVEDRGARDIILSVSNPRKRIYMGTYKNRTVTPEYVGYVATTEGQRPALSKITYIPTRVDGEDGISVTGNGNVELITDTLDFGDRDFTTIHSIELGGTNIPSLSVYLGYKKAHTESSFTWTAAVTPDVRGVAVFGLSAIEFQIKITGSSLTALNLTRLRVITGDGEKLGLKGILS